MKNFLNNMNQINQAIEAAKKNPESNYAKELRRRIESGSLDKELSEAGLSEKYNRPMRETFISKTKEAFGDIKQVGTDIMNQSLKRGENISEIKQALQSGEQGGVRSVLQTAGQLAGAGADAITAVGKGAANLLLSDKSEKVVTDVIGKFGAKVMANPQVQNIINEYNALPEEKQRDIDAVGGVLDLVSNFIGGQAVSAGADVAETGVKTATKGIKTATVQAVDTVGDVAKSAVPKTKDAFISFVSPNIDDTVKKTLQNTPTEKFDAIVDIGRNAADPANPSVYEYVAESMSNATKQIDNQVRSLSQQKNTIINKAKTGLKDFTKETGSTILQINKSLKDSPTADLFINRLKQVKTKIDADKAIDELQDILYKGNKDMTIPVGSSEDKALKGILGKYNSTLKSSLPASYSKINTEIANRLNTLNVLNRSLGEVVDGVSTRGAGLVKQFFSPAGTKTKQLFDYIKKTTGTDLAQDVILAKYVGEAFGDTKIKSLLEGVPTSRAGAIDRLVDFTLEKTGASDALRKAKQEGMLKKAKSLTK